MLRQTRDVSAAGVLRHPTGFWFIFWGELAERASYYGMAGILLRYITEEMLLSKDAGGMIVQIFKACCYILPILGGYVADRWLGKFKTIMIFAVPYILGHVVLGSFNSKVGLAVALMLLAGGSGAIKPNISTLMGMMYEQAGKKALLTQAFSWFYMAINIGAAATMTSLPFIRDKYGYQVAFMAPTLLMVVSFAIFALGKKYYPKETRVRGPRPIKSAAQRLEERLVLKRLSGMFLLIVFFWSIFDQSASTWVYFAKDYLNLKTVFGTIPADAIQGVNPILVVMMTPFFAWLWRANDRSRRKLSSPKKMLIGFGLVILCMFVMSVAGYIAEAKKISILWEVGAYVLITMAELCISIIGLQLAYEEAPDHMKSLITGVFLCTVFIGNLLASQFVLIYNRIPPGPYFSLMTVMITLVAIAFLFVGRRFEKRPAY